MFQPPPDLPLSCPETAVHPLRSCLDATSSVQLLLPRLNESLPFESGSLNLVPRWLSLLYQADLQGRALSDSLLPACPPPEQAGVKEQGSQGLVNASLSLLGWWARQSRGVAGDRFLALPLMSLSLLKPPDFVCAVRTVQLISEVVQGLDLGIKPQFPSLGNGYPFTRFPTLRLRGRWCQGQRLPVQGAGKEAVLVTNPADWERARSVLFPTVVTTYRPERGGGCLGSQHNGEEIASMTQSSPILSACFPCGE